jgi:hypothetical protein
LSTDIAASELADEAHLESVTAAGARVHRL